MSLLLQVRPAHPLSTLRLGLTCSLSSLTPARFRPSQLDNIECVEDYRPGGFHPVVIGDVFARGRYRIVHKLGFGGSSTIWLARNRPGKLVTLKVMRAEMSSKPVDKIPELVIPRKLLERIQMQGPATHLNIQTVEDFFIEDGPNGSHLYSPGRVIGSRRLRRDLAKKVAKQVVGAVKLMHAVGLVHGDITTPNILFRVAENVRSWSDSDVYINFGEPETEKVITRDHSPLRPHVPAQLVAPIDNAYLTNSAFLQEDALLIDFGQSFSSFHPQADYKPATVPHYQSPEARFEGRIGMPSDIWALTCTIFEIRAGFPLFETFLGGDDEILKEIVVVLGKFPEPWWGAFENHHLWFDEDGNLKAQELQRGLLTEKTSIKQKLASIGDQDVPSVTGTDGPMMERPGTRLDMNEIELLGDLLDKMLRYRSQDRIKISEVISHPWFALG